VRPPVTLAVLASGTGSNFEALVRASRAPGFPARIGLLVTDSPVVPALERARRLDVPALALHAGRFRSRIEDETGWRDALISRGVEGLLLAGFLRLLDAPLLEAFPQRVLNIHPSLLPAFSGLDAIRRAWEHGVRVTGCTVHVVDAQLDAGPIVAQAPVEIADGETLESLEARIHEAEHALYPEAVRRYFGESHHVEGRRIVFDGSGAASRV